MASPIKKKNNFDFQINNINIKDSNMIDSEKAEKLAAIIPIILPRINSPNLKGNFNTKKINHFDETNFPANNNAFPASSNVITAKNIHRTSLKAYK